METYNEQEEFRDIPGYEGHYQVSNLGRVKSFKRNKEKILKPLPVGFAGKKYLMVALNKNGDKKVMKIHLLVAIVFLNHVVDGFNLVIDHIDSNRFNNKLDNLRIVTFRENCSKEVTLKSGLPVGVIKIGKKYVSRITIKSKRYYLGRFITVEEASAAYQSALTKINNNEQL